MILFILISIAFPLALEMHKKGADNLLARSGKELTESKTVIAIASGVTRGLGTTGREILGGVAALGMGSVLVLGGWFIVQTVSVVAKPIILQLTHGLQWLQWQQF